MVLSPVSSLFMDISTEILPEKSSGLWSDVFSLKNLMLLKSLSWRHCVSYNQILKF